MKYGLITASCLGLATLAAHAETPPGVPLAVQVLLSAAQAAVAACELNSYKVTVTVLDADTTTRLVLRADAAHDDTLEFSYRKAYTAAKTGLSSREFGKTVPNSAQLDPKPGSGPPKSPGPVNGDAHLITWPGGFPIMVGGKLVGAMGAGGAPGGEKDEACVKAGLAKIPGLDK